jgi:histidine phosphotransferase ChpT
MDLPALITARICHDLISPLGAIGNGVELLEMAQTTSGPELALISQSVHQAQARVRLFRIAFGVARLGQMIGADELRGILRDYTAQVRFDLDWPLQDSLPKPAVKLALLALLCLETALPYGGAVSCDISRDAIVITGKSEKLLIDEELWTPLAAGAAWPEDLRAARVQFPLLQHEVTAQKMSMTVTMSEDQLGLRIFAA